MKVGLRGVDRAEATGTAGSGIVLLNFGDDSNMARALPRNHFFMSARATIKYLYDC